MDFELFLEDMGTAPSDKHSIERINNDGNYESSNCCWATAKEQARNRRSTFYVEYMGIKKSLAEWSEELALPYKQTWKRIRVFGWTVEQAFIATR